MADVIVNRDGKLILVVPSGQKGTKRVLAELNLEGMKPSQIVAVAEAAAKAAEQERRKSFRKGGR